MEPLLAETEVAPPPAVRLQAVAPGGRTLIPPTAGLALVVAGLVVVGAVTAALLLPGADPGPAAPAARPPATGGITVTGAEDVEVRMVTYLPGEASSWHRHPGLHAVAVLSGTLTVYGPDCQAQSFGPGQSYVGGQQAHLAQNSTGAPLEMAVTYLVAEGSSMADFLIPAAPPPGCAVR